MRANDATQTLESVLSASGLTLDEFRSPDRSQPLFFARMVYANLRHRQGAKTTEIGREINRNHTSVSRMLMMHDIDFKCTPAYAELYRTVDNKLIPAV